MALVNIVIALALCQYIVFAFAVGKARGRCNVPAPAITGNAEFERYYRVQMNTLELLIAFIPASLIFGYYVSSLWAAVLGLVYLVGRVLYFLAYIQDPSRRELGFALSLGPIGFLLLGALYGATRVALGL